MDYLSLLNRKRDFWYETEYALGDKHFEAEHNLRFAPRRYPLTEQEASACELAIGSVCNCRCGGFYHGIAKALPQYR